MSMLLQATEAVAETTEQTMGLGELFLAGGWLMWPLLLLGGVTIFIFCERFWAIKQASRMDVNFMNRIRDLIYEGKIAAAVQLCRSTNTPISHMIEKGIQRIGRPLSDVNTSIENVANLEVSKLERGLPFYDCRWCTDDRFPGYGNRYGRSLYEYGGRKRYCRYEYPGQRYVCGDGDYSRWSDRRYPRLFRIQLSGSTY